MPTPALVALSASAAAAATSADLAAPAARR